MNPTGWSMINSSKRHIYSLEITEGHEWSFWYSKMTTLTKLWFWLLRLQDLWYQTPGLGSFWKPKYFFYKTIVFLQHFKNTLHPNRALTIIGLFGTHTNCTWISYGSIQFHVAGGTRIFFFAFKKAQRSLHSEFHVLFMVVDCSPTGDKCF